MYPSDAYGHLSYFEFRLLSWRMLQNIKEQEKEAMNRTIAYLWNISIPKISLIKLIDQNYLQNYQYKHN